MRFFLVLLILSIICISCFEKDDVIIPKKEYSGKIMVFGQSIYDNQFFYNLGTNTIQSWNPNNTWDLSFDCRLNNHTIRINSANFLGVCETNTNDFDATAFLTTGLKWNFDLSNGDEDSVAIAGWVKRSGNSYVYSNRVYLIGNTTDGYIYTPLKKMVFYMVTDTSYRFKYANIDGSGFHDVLVLKDTSYNRAYFNLTTNNTVLVEPPKKDWDLMFTQYFSFLYTSSGLKIPYPLRGVLLNSYNVKAVVDSVNNFEAISLHTAQGLDFSDDWDVIGYNWKDVIVDQSANSAIYSIRQKYNYIIQDTKGAYYKLKFLSFANSKLEVGYPTFIIEKL